MPIYTAGKIFVAVCVLMPVFAALSLHYAVHRRFSLIPSLAFVLSYNYMLSRGFLNYLFSTGLAVMLFAIWIASAGLPRWRRAAAFGVLALLLYMSHVFAFISYGLLVGGYEAGRAWRCRLRPLGLVAADISAAAGQAAPTMLVAWRFHVAGMVGTVNVTEYGSPGGRLAALLSPLYFPGAHLVVAICILVPLCFVVALPRFRMASAIWPAALAAFLAACVIPHVLFNLWGADFRLPLVVAIVVIGGLSIRQTQGRFWRMSGLFVLAGLVTLRATDAALLLRALDVQVADIRQTLAALPSGARLLVVDSGKQAPGRVAPDDMTAHFGLLATIDHEAFVPFLFTGVTAVRIRSAYLSAASPNSGPISLAQLLDTNAGERGMQESYGYGGQAYWLGWPSKFDDVLIVHFGQALTNLPPLLQLIAAGSIANLYRVKQP